MSEKDWEVGAVLKNKPGSQGTLFRGGSKYSSPDRFPRGYTPERQAEVRGLIRGTGMNSYDDPNNIARHRREIADTVARSTVPTSHLQGLQWAHVEANTELTRDGQAAGVYFPATERREAMIGVKPKYTGTGTVIHEIGHHVSAQQGNEHASGKNYSYESEHGGREEAFADNYAQEHFRTRQGKQQERGMYGGGKWAGHIQRSDSFWEGYGKSRTFLPDPESDARNEKFLRQYPEERAHPDNTVDEPMIHRDYNDHSLSVNSEAVPTENYGRYYDDHYR